MVVRIRTRFRAKGPRTLDDRASAVASNVWKISQEAARHMEIEGYKLGSDHQVTAVLSEFIAFLIHISDRIVYGQLSESDRSNFINALAKNLARLIATNLTEFVGSGDYVTPFIKLLNARLSDYAEFKFTDTGPAYATLRYLGEKVSEAMAATDNKWVLEQVIDIEAPAAIKLVKKVVGEILGVKVT